MATYSSRMGLIKPAGSEARSNVQLNTNADLLDKFMPCILVNDGVTPPTGDLYDGALVKEKTSGKLWEARKNGGGTFDKVWVRYPWNITAFTTGSAVGTGTTFTEWVLTTFSSGKNSSASDIVAGKIVLPVKGIYRVSWRHKWDPNSSGQRAARMLVNGVVESDKTEASVASCSALAFTSLHMYWDHQFDAGTTLSSQLWQNSGGNLNVFIWANVTLVDPVQ